MPILFDLDGVFYQGNKPIEGSSDVYEWVKNEKIDHLFVTNTTSSSRSAIVSKLAKFNIYTSKEHILTPIVAMVHWLRNHPAKHKIALYLAETTQSEFSDLLPEENKHETVSDVIIGDLAEGWTYNRLNQIFRILMQHPTPNFFALGMTRYNMAEDGLRLDVAPFIVALEYATGIQAHNMGKPAQSFFDTAVDILGGTSNTTFMIGDDIYGDVDGAQSAGLKGILVKTGKYLPGDLAQGIQPYAILDSINDLPDWWKKVMQVHELY